MSDSTILAKHRHGEVVLCAFAESNEEVHKVISKLAWILIQEGIDVQHGKHEDKPYLVASISSFQEKKSG